MVTMESQAHTTDGVRLWDVLHHKPLPLKEDDRPARTRNHQQGRIVRPARQLGEFADRERTDRCGVMFGQPLQTLDNLIGNVAQVEGPASRSQSIKIRRSMSNLEEIFTELTGDLDYPMLIVTTQADGETAGCLVGFSTQCSIDPPRFIVCLSDKNHTFRVASRAAALAVHFIPSDDTDLARLFGSQTGDSVDKFAQCRWHPGPLELPLLDDCPRWFVGQILSTQTVGDHAAFVLEPIAANSDGDDDNLDFGQVKDLEPGHDA
jgi:flavin reductase (DIM6/NTAB) family NADH-FMN oxidoreductase RutF